MVIQYGPDADELTKVWVYLDNKSPLSYHLDTEADVLIVEDTMIMSTRKIVEEAIAGAKKS